MTTLLIALLILLLAALGAPLFALVAAVAWLGLHSAGYDETLLAAQFWSLTEMPVLIAIPLFTLAGHLLSESKAPQRLLRLSEALLGWLHGGLAIVALLVCAFFTAFTGASGVTIIAFGALLLPALRQAGYPERFSYGVVTTAPSLGMLFAPSVPLILYGIVAQQLSTTPSVSINDMFAAGVLPGLMMIAVVSAYSMWRAPKRSHDIPFSLAEARAAVWDARWELPLPVILIGGVYGGVFATSEAAAVVAQRVARGAARDRCGHGRLQRAVLGQPEGRPHDRHRDEPARVAFICAGFQGHGLPDCQGGGQAGRGLYAGRTAQRDHRWCHASEL